MARVGLRWRQCDPDSVKVLVREIFEMHNDNVCKSEKLKVYRLSFNFIKNRETLNELTTEKIMYTSSIAGLGTMYCRNSRRRVVVTSTKLKIEKLTMSRAPVGTKYGRAGLAILSIVSATSTKTGECSVDIYNRSAQTTQRFPSLDSEAIPLQA